MWIDCANPFGDLLQNDDLEYIIDMKVCTQSYFYLRPLSMHSEGALGENYRHIV